jgi:hypothetical protein
MAHGGIGNGCFICDENAKMNVFFVSFGYAEVNILERKANAKSTIENRSTP